MSSVFAWFTQCVTVIIIMVMIMILTTIMIIVIMSINMPYVCVVWVCVHIFLLSYSHLLHKDSLDGMYLNPLLVMGKKWQNTNKSEKKSQ